jgi:hypothetical protein
LVECFLYTEEVSGSNPLSLMFIRYFKEGLCSLVVKTTEL